MTVAYTYDAQPIEGGTISLHGANTSWCALEDNKIFIVYKQDGVHRTFGVVATLNGNQAPTFSTPQVINTWNYTYPHFKAIKVVSSEDAAGEYTVVVHQIDANGIISYTTESLRSYFMVVKIASDNTMVAGSPVAAPNNGWGCARDLASNQTDYFWFGQVDGSVDDFYLRRYQISGTGMTLINNNLIDSSAIYDGVYMRKLENGRITGYCSATSTLEAGGFFRIETDGSYVGGSGTFPGRVWASDINGQYVASVYSNQLWITNSVGGGRVATLPVAFANAAQDIIALGANDDYTWMVAEFPAHGSASTAQSINIRMFRWIPSPVAAIASEINPVTLPVAIRGHWTYTNHTSYQTKNQNFIFHRIDADNVAAIGVYNDGSANKVGFQIMTAL